MTSSTQDVLRLLSNLSDSDVEARRKKLPPVTPADVLSAAKHFLTTEDFAVGDLVSWKPMMASYGGRGNFAFGVVLNCFQKEHSNTNPINWYDEDGDLKNEVCDLVVGALIPEPNGENLFFATFPVPSNRVYKVVIAEGKIPSDFVSQGDNPATN